MSSYLTPLLVVVLSGVATIHAGCPAPISLPLRNTTLQQNGLIKAVALPLGTPPQMFAFIPHGGYNNTYIPDNSGSCPDGTTVAKCIAQNGGQFNEVQSSTWAQSADINAAGASPESDEDISGVTWGVDSMQINGTYSLPQVPLGIDPSLRGQLGLGRNSSFLSKLTSAAIIPSNSWSYWWGLQGAEQADQMDGQLVLGGYDAAKVQGNNYTQVISPETSACRSGLMVDITGMKIRAANGTKADLFNMAQMSSYKSCVDLSRTVSGVPLPIWQSFVQATGIAPTNRSYGILDYFGWQFAANRVFDGDLEITIGNKLTITMANSELVLPERDVDDNGRPVILSDKTRTVLLDSLQGSQLGDLPWLARSFMTSAYLHVNNEQKEFALWQVNPTTDQNIIPVAGKVDASCGPPSSSPTGVPTATSTSTSLDPSSSPTPSSQKLATGPLIAIIIGSVALLALLILLTLFLLRRRRKRALLAARPRHSEIYPPIDQYAPGAGAKAYPGHATVQELGLDGEIPAMREMSADQVRSEAPEGNARYEAGVRHTAYYAGGGAGGEQGAGKPLGLGLGGDWRQQQQQQQQPQYRQQGAGGWYSGPVAGSESGPCELPAYERSPTKDVGGLRYGSGR